MENTQILFANRPEGMPTAENFEIVRTPVGEPNDGEVLRRTLYLSVDPYMRGRMNDRKSYVPPRGRSSARRWWGRRWRR